MALTQINLTLELREILLSDRPRELYHISPKGTVPVLFLKNGEVIDESLDIMLWCFKKLNGQIDYSSQLELIKIIDGDFKYWLDRYKYHNRFPEYPQVYYRDKCVDILNNIENILGNKPFIINNNIQFTDMAIFPLIRQFVYVDRLWFSDRFQALTEWYLQIQISSIFTSVMEKYDLWVEGLDPKLVNFFEKRNNERSILKTL